MDDTRKRAVWLYKSVRDTHEQAFTSMNQMRADLIKNPNLEKIIDVVALLKKAEALTKDLKAEINKSLRDFQKVGCMLFIRDNRLGESVRTEWVTSHPDTKTVPPLPHKSTDPEGYAKFCEWFGVPPDAPFKPHWPSVVDYVTAQETEMKELPPGIDPEKCNTEYTLVCRFNKDCEPDSIVSDVLLDDPFSYPPNTRN